MRLIAWCLVLAGLALAGSRGWAADSRTNASSASARPRTSLFADKVVATGKGLEIRRSQVEDAFIALKATAAAQGKSIPESERAAVESQLLLDLINERILLDRASEADQAKGQVEGDKLLAEYKARWTSPESFSRQLLAWGMPLEQFHARLVEKATFAEVINRELRPRITVSDDLVKKFYQDNAAQFELPERVRLSQIFFLYQDPQTRRAYSEEERARKRQLADLVLARLKAGEDFAQLARQYSEDPPSRDRGGEIGTLTRNQIAKELQATAFSLRTNQVSNPLESQFGLHLIKVHEKIPARTIPYAEAEKDIKTFLTNQELQNQIPAYLKKLRLEAGIKILEDR